MKHTLQASVAVVLTALLLSGTAIAPLHAQRDGGKGKARTSVNSNKNVNQNANVNVNSNRNVNRNTNVNIDRDVDVDVDIDHHHGCCYSSGGGFVAGAVVGAAVTAAVVVGTRVNTLPPACTVMIVNGITYQQCGGTYYQPQFVGTSTTYVVVNPPR